MPPEEPKRGKHAKKLTAAMVVNRIFKRSQELRKLVEENPKVARYRSAYAAIWSLYVELSTEVSKAELAQLPKEDLAEYVALGVVVIGEEDYNAAVKKVFGDYLTNPEEIIEEAKKIVPQMRKEGWTELGLSEGIEEDEA